MSRRDLLTGCPFGLMGLLTVVVSLAPGASSEESKTGSALTEGEAKAFVDYHNQKRAEVKVPEVTWSKEVAQFAQEWANQIAETGKVAHRPREGPFQQKYGENIAWGFGNFGVREAGEVWYREKKAYDSGKQKLPEDLQEIGHYTQMVWKKSLKIGAGKAVIKQGGLKGWTVFVCNYDPPGNANGEKPY